VAFLVALCVILTPAALVAQHEAEEKAAVTAGQKWLGLIDAGQYAESWKEASTMFRAAVSQQQWEQQLRAVRKPLGELVSRQIKNKTYATSLPGAPDGEYVVMQFETSFQNKKSAVETVTAKLDEDGTWRMAGYFIR
jgi:Protein of unknown function (DUF4019)